MRIKMREVLSITIMLLCLVYIVCALWVINDLDNTALATSQPTAAQQQGAAFALSREQAESFIVGYAALQFEPYVSPEPQSGEEDAWLYEYEAPEGFTIVSNSLHWGEAKLAGLYNELKKNHTGDEIYALSQIIVFKDRDTATTANSRFTGGHSSSVSIGIGRGGVEVPLSFFSGTIELYNGDRLTRVEDFAWPLSYAYGQMYTQHYMFAGAGADTITSNYADLRGLADFNPEDHTEQEVDEYAAFIAATAAEDYLQLMGSPNALASVYYPDILEQAAGHEVPEGYDFTHTIVQPQSNIDIPLAWQMPSLADYFYSFIDGAPAASSDEEYHAGITVSRVLQEDGTFSYYRPQYEVTWNAPYKNATYTLVRRVEDHYMPIKTVPRGAEALATIGGAETEDEEWLRDYFVTGNVTFYVVASLPDGRTVRSEPLEYWFG